MCLNLMYHLPRCPVPAVLFANVIASGIKIIINGDPLTRRSRFILACSLALAFGVELVPQWATLNLWPVTPGMSPGLRGLRDAIILVISTSFTLGAVVALILNLIIPKDTSTATCTNNSLHVPELEGKMMAADSKYRNHHSRRAALGFLLRHERPCVYLSHPQQRTDGHAEGAPRSRVCVCILRLHSVQQH